MAWACSYAQGASVCLKTLSTWEKTPINLTVRLTWQSEITWQQRQSEI